MISVALLSKISQKSQLIARYSLNFYSRSHIKILTLMIRAHAFLLTTTTPPQTLKPTPHPFLLTTTKPQQTRKSGRTPLTFSDFRLLGSFTQTSPLIRYHRNSRRVYQLRHLFKKPRPPLTPPFTISIFCSIT